MKLNVFRLVSSFLLQTVILTFSLSAFTVFLLFSQTEIIAGSHLSRPPHNLSCYHCSTLNDGESCRDLKLNNTENQRSCKPNQMFCSVVLFRYSTDSSEYIFWSVERSCEETCQEGCNTVGERVKLFLCRSCCTKYLCNYGNTALKSTTPDENYVILMTGMALYRYFSFFKTFETLLWN